MTDREAGQQGSALGPPGASDDLVSMFAAEQDTPYAQWVRAEGLEILSSCHVPDLRTVELRPWPRRGGRGVFLNHDASRTSSDSYVCEIPPDTELAPQRQMYEEMVYVLDGLGATVVWNEAGQRVTFEWKAGAVFAIPLNAWHQHFNGSGTTAARYVAVTNAPAIINAFGDLDFVFNTAYDFTGRFGGEPKYFSGRSERQGLLLDTNVVGDARRLSLKSTREQGGVDGHVRLRMARGQMSGHISQVSVGTYTRAHAQGPGAHLIILDGEGYSLVWRRGGAPERYDWKAGTMFVPPNQCYQQHFNTGSIPARYLAIETDTVAIRNSEGVPKAWISERLGGDRISYADESPRMRQLFAEALAARGLTSKMDEAYAAELREEREVARQSMSAPAVGQGGEQ